jgi:thioredoxin reductase
VNDISIIGAGPAGIAAAIYLKRAGFESLVYEKGDVGGLLLNANRVENYPGFPGGLSGYNLVCLMKEQLSILNISITRKEIKVLVPADGSFQLRADSGEENSKVVILATGTHPQPIELIGVEPLFDRKIFYEIKDIPQSQREDSYMIIGGGDAAFDYALNLSKRAARVDILFRSVNPRCLPLLQERVALRENIKIHPETSVLEVKEENEQLVFPCTSGDKPISFTSDFALIACGRAPNLEVIPEEIRNTFLINDDGTTDFPGLFVAGDVRRGQFRQAGIAVGDGILSAMKAEHFLRGDEE